MNGRYAKAESNGFPLARLAAEKLGIDQQDVADFISEYVDMQVLYHSAINVVSTRLQILNDEFQFRHKRNPIHNIQTRLKTPRSMLDKMGRRNLDLNMDILRAELTDIAGVRVICSYVDDIYDVADMLCAQDNIELVRIGDYIKEPKPNGYRSLHIVVKAPVYFSDGKHQIPVEIQIRTIAMDFWASLEHELRYKAAAEVPQDIVVELRDCAEHITQLDDRMLKVYRRLEEIE